MNGARRHNRRNLRGRCQNLRGPRRALSLDEQLEVQRLMREATAEHRRHRTVLELAARYGVSSRTIWRYLHTVATPEGTELLRLRLQRWAEERGIELTTDDIVTLLYVIARHREHVVVETAA